MKRGQKWHFLTGFVLGPKGFLVFSKEGPPCSALFPSPLGHVRYRPAFKSDPPLNDDKAVNPKMKFRKKPCFLLCEISPNEENPNSSHSLRTMHGLHNGHISERNHLRISSSKCAQGTCGFYPANSRKLLRWIRRHWDWAQKSFPKLPNNSCCGSRSVLHRELGR